MHVRRPWTVTPVVALGLTAALAACSSGTSTGPTLSQTAPSTSTTTTSAIPTTTPDTQTSISPSGTGGPVLPGSLSPLEFQSVSLRPNVIIVDVRPLSSYRNGHLPKAINLDYQQPDFATSFTQLDASKSFAIYDDSGTTTRQVIATLAGMGYLSTTDLKGGYQAWKAAGLPTFTGVPTSSATG